MAGAPRPLFGDADTSPVPLEAALGNSIRGGHAVRPHLACDPREVADAARIEELLAARDRALGEARSTRETAASEAEAARVDHAARMDAYADAIVRLGEAAGALPTRLAGEVVDLAMIVATELVGRELAADRDRAVAALAETLASAGPILELRVSAADLRHLRERRPELAEGVPITCDDALDPGGFVVECADTVIDGTVQTRIEAMREAVAAAYPQPENQPDEPAEIPAGSSAEDADGA